MKRFGILLSLALVTILTLASFAVLPALSAADKDTIRVMIAYQPGQKGAMQRLLNSAGAETHYEFDELNVLALTLPTAALDGISRNPLVVYVEEDPIRTMIGGTLDSVSLETALAAAPPPQVVPYGIDMVQARDVWDADRNGVVDAGAPTGTNRLICIIDSGVYAGHEDLAGVNLVGGYPTGWNTDGFGHGTHVAGTIAAANNTLGVVGVTPGTVKLYIVKVFGDDGAWAYSSTLVDAANRCKTGGANIISMSLSGTRASRTERIAFDNLYAAGILSVAAASNDGTTAYAYPASYDSVVSVAAIDSSKTVADFSNFNDQVELAAPGVGVLSTVPYIETNEVLVDGITYIANHIEYSGRGTATGILVNGDLCGAANPTWSGKIVLCQRGTYSFAEKVLNVQNSGGAAALIYNNLDGNFLGTMDPDSSTIIGLSLSLADGQYLVAYKLGAMATVTSNVTIPASGFEAWDGTSMATPHVSAVAALVWSAMPTATNVEIRDALTATALDLGTAGKDVYYGYGLVQAADALAYLGSTPPPPPTSFYSHVADLAGVATKVGSSWKATITITVQDEKFAPVANATVTGAFSGGYTGTVTCVTNTSGQCSVSTPSLKKTVASVTYTVSNIAHTTLTYKPADNVETSITVAKP